MQNIIRCLAVYDWEGDLNLASHPAILVELVKDIDKEANKIAYYVPEIGKERKMTTSKNRNIEFCISSIMAYDYIEIGRLINKSYFDVISHISYSTRNRRRDYVAARQIGSFSVDDALEHLKLYCRNFSPLYGFSITAECAAALIYVGGSAAMGMDHETIHRAANLGVTLRQSKEHLTGKLYDVYELNVLSQKHLERAVCGRPLWAWIGAGRRGELIRITDSVTAWLVPDDIRPGVRQTLFSDGALIAPL